MPKFFTISNNSHSTREFPWISNLIQGFGETYYCKREERTIHYATGKMVGRLQPNKGTKWPDALGCGEFPFLIVSDRVIEAWKKENIGEFPAEELQIAQPFPEKLQHKNHPSYFWIDGSKLRGALIDFEASGFADVKFCPECGTRTDDIPKTFKNQHPRDADFSYVFREDTWNGLNLFTTDISPTLFFCTDVVVDCAKKHGHRNFSFVPIEEGFGFY